MIDWMQKHKKWLVITIWISTISFIAAGMVGWGSYNFGINASEVAKVGNVKITQVQFQSYYRQLFNQYNQDGSLDLTKAKELGLDKIALEQLIRYALVENFALDLGLRVNQKEIFDEIAKIEAFQKNAKFDASTYKEVLKQNNLKPSDFEEEVRKDLLIRKVANLLPKSYLTDLEKEAFLMPLKIEDEVKIKILQQSQIKALVDEGEIKEFWEKHKDQYQYPIEYKIEYIVVANKDQKPTQDELLALYGETKSKYLDEKGNIKPFELVQKELLEEQQEILAEDKALREYVALKKAQKGYGKEEVLIEGDKKFGIEVFEQLEKANIGDVLKPLKVKEGFLTLRVNEKKLPSPKSLEDARAEIKIHLLNKKKQAILLERAKAMIKNQFDGVSLGYIHLMEQKKISSLTDQEWQIFLANVLGSSTKRGYVLLGDKAIVFEIFNQKLNEKAQKVNEGMLEMLKAQIIDEEFYKYLRNQYKITYIQEGLRN